MDAWKAQKTLARAVPSGAERPFSPRRATCLGASEGVVVASWVCKTSKTAMEISWFDSVNGSRKLAKARTTLKKSLPHSDNVLLDLQNGHIHSLFESALLYALLRNHLDHLNNLLLNRAALEQTMIRCTSRT